MKTGEKGGEGIAGAAAVEAAEAMEGGQARRESKAGPVFNLTPRLGSCGLGGCGLRGCGGHCCCFISARRGRKRSGKRSICDLSNPN